MGFIIGFIMGLVKGKGAFGFFDFLGFTSSA